MGCISNQDEVPEIYDFLKNNFFDGELFSPQQSPAWQVRTVPEIQGEVDLNFTWKYNLSDKKSPKHKNKGWTIMNKK